MGVRLTDQQIADLIEVIKNFKEGLDDADFILQEWQDDIIALARELQARREHDAELTNASDDEH